MPGLTCPRCTATDEPDLRYLTYESEADGRHLGAYCRHCTRWIRWVPQVAEWAALYAAQQGARPRCRDCGRLMSVVRISDVCGPCKGGAIPAGPPSNARDYGDLSVRAALPGQHRDSPSLPGFE